MKKLLSIFLSLVLIILQIDIVTVFADTTSGDYIFSVYNNSIARIKGYTGSGGNVTIPSKIDGCTVTSISNDAFKDCNTLTSITIPSSVTSIGDYVFSGCNSLTSINVDAYNTAYCSFDGILYNKLKTTLISYPAGKTNSTFVVPSNVISISNGAFGNCNSLTNIIIPNSTISIGDRVFDGCSSLTSITIPSNVTRIGDWAFGGCSSLTSITIPSSVTSIGNSAFECCSKLTDITIPSSVTSIGDQAFYACNSLTSITIPSGVTSIGSNTFFDCCSLTNITIPSSVISIGNFAFECCSKLTNITIPSSVISIGDWAFDDCHNLKNIIIPSSVTSIGVGAFWDCSSLTSITIPSSITEISKFLFAGCSNLTSITIPNSVTSIGYQAFSGSGLTSITIPSSLTSIGYGAFSGSGLTSITIPSSVTSIGENAFDSCGNLTSITIPSSVTSISYNAFAKCSSLTSITIPNSVTSIGENAFYSCSSLTSIIIPSSITSISTFMFSDCSSLTSITIPSSITSIGYGAFFGCSKLTNITIPSSITKISGCAYENCSSLTSVTIPSSVTSINYDSFYQCPSNLVIYYHNTAIGFTNPWNGYKTVACNIVSYNGNGNTAGTVPVDNNMYTQGTKATIINNTGNLVKTGYTFAGWNTAADGSGTSYPADSIVSMNGADITLYAQWIALISPASGTFVKGEATDLTTVITAVNKTLNPITGIYNGETKLIDGTDEKITDTDTGYTLTLNKSYLSKLTTSNTVITIKFKDGSSLSYTAIETIPTDRISGDNRFETAAEISKKGWTTTSEYAVIATGEDYPDALCAAPLAKKYGAPIILTEKNKLSDAAKNELTRLSVKKVFIVGGTGAVSSDVETEITNLGILPTRIAGADRYETSLNIAKQLGINNPPTAINIATGDNFADALSISSIAAMKGEPILLTSKDSINDDIKQYIKDNSSTITASYIIGGTGVISDAVANSLKNPIRLYGKNRYETNTAVLNYFKNDLKDLNLSNIYLATGDNFPDALAASALAAETKSPILLVGSSVDDSTKSFVNNNNSILKITAVGGTGVISDDTLESF